MSTHFTFNVGQFISKFYELCKNLKSAVLDGKAQRKFQILKPMTHALSKMFVPPRKLRTSPGRNPVSPAA